MPELAVLLQELGCFTESQAGQSQSSKCVTGAALSISSEMNLWHNLSETLLLQARGIPIRSHPGVQAPLLL